MPTVSKYVCGKTMQAKKLTLTPKNRQFFKDSEYIQVDFFPFHRRQET
jgi:hypothetical protein